MSVSDPRPPGDRTTVLSTLLDGLPHQPDDQVIASGDDRVTLAELRARVRDLAEAIREAGVKPGQPVGNLAGSGPSAVVAMFATWEAGAVYVPINRRNTAHEITTFIAETPLALLMGEPADIAPLELSTGLLASDYQNRDDRILATADPQVAPYDPEIALVLRTSGTTGRPKAVLLQHASTIEALDASLQKLRRRRSAGSTRREPRMNLIPVSLALWAGIFNTLFSFRAGFGVVLLDRFTATAFARAVREFHITSTVLAPAMITMLTDATDIDDLAPLRLVRSITAPLSPEVARQFHDRFGAFVLNSYGQTELGGEVVGWTTEDLREYGESKLGAAGRPYDHVDLRIRRPDGSDADPDEFGEIFVQSPYRMHGYAMANGSTDVSGDRFVDDYLRTGDMGRLDKQGFLWVQGRVSDMINRGGLKVFPDEVEEVLRRHPHVREAGVAGVPDRRLGEVPHAWVAGDADLNADDLEPWCRQHLVPYKVPVAFTVVDELPRSEIGKLLRRELAARFVTGDEASADSSA